MSREGQGLAVFLVLVFGLTWAVEIGLVRRYEVASPAYAALLTVVMFIPALCALVVRVFVERQGFGDAGLRWGRGRYYAAAWLLPVGFGAAAFGLAIWLRQAEFDPWMTDFMVKFHVTSPETTMPSFHLMRAIVILANLAAVLVNPIPCFKNSLLYIQTLTVNCQEIHQISYFSEFP